jgi:hypothetical protein
MNSKRKRKSSRNNSRKRRSNNSRRRRGRRRGGLISGGECIIARCFYSRAERLGDRSVLTLLVIEVRKWFHTPTFFRSRDSGLFLNSTKLVLHRHCARLANILWWGRR